MAEDDKIILGDPEAGGGITLHDPEASTAGTAGKPYAHRGCHIIFSPGFYRLTEGRIPFLPRKLRRIFVS
jgi:hypothetical protein